MYNVYNNPAPRRGPAPGLLYTLYMYIIHIHVCIRHVYNNPAQVRLQPEEEGGGGPLPVTVGRLGGVFPELGPQDIASVTALRGRPARGASRTYVAAGLERRPRPQRGRLGAYLSQGLLTKSDTYIYICISRRPGRGSIRGGNEDAGRRGARPHSFLYLFCGSGNMNFYFSSII